MISNYNSFILIKFSSQLFEMDLPEDIYLIEKYKVRGKLNRNGFFACILVKTERSQNKFLIIKIIRNLLRQKIMKM